MPRIWLRMTFLLLLSTNRQTTPRGNRARAPAPVFGTGTIRTNAANNQRIPKHRTSDAAPTPLPHPVAPPRASTAPPPAPPRPARPSKAPTRPRKQAEEAPPPRPHRKTPPTKTTSMAIEQPDKKASPAERRSRSTEVVEQTQRRERVYPGAYGWPEDEPFAYRGGRPYVPPPVYGEVPGEMGPVPFAPPWSYRNRSFAWGPYPGMDGPRAPW